MGFKKRYLSFLCTVAVISVSYAQSNDDTVTVEAEPEQDINRKGKQFILGGPAYPYQAYNPFVVPTSFPNLATTGPCITSKGLEGKCMPFRQCYPYFKLPELGNWDSWILGMADACSYYTVQGRQVFGVCCLNTTTVTPINEIQTPEPIIEDTESNNTTDRNEVKYPVYPNWPPPIPTHPPNHTVPPLPTHPPSPGYPTSPPSSKPPSSKPPVSKPTAWPPSGWPPSYPPTAWPPSRPPSAWPPTSGRPPSRPPSQPTKPPTKPPQVDSASCGAKNGFQDQERIVGGHNADIGEWPWIAALFNGGRQFCGGSLIDNIHILSAAHCVAHMSSWDVARLTVRLSDHNIKTNSEIRHIEKRVKRVVRHRGFDPRTLYNDISILTLESPVQFSQLVRPICLPNSATDYTGRTGTVIGWGSIRESGPQPAVLQEVNIPIWSNRECRVKYGPAAPGGIVEHMLCAGQAAKDSCSGDSGGPLMINNGRWTQIGIVSWGIGCGKGQYPGVYTRVEKFLPWIHKNLK